MPDYAMCDDDRCPYRKQCRRSPDSGTRPDGYKQTWGFFVKRGDDSEPSNCDGWWPASTLRQCPDGYPSCRKAEATGEWCVGQCEAEG